VTTIFLTGFMGSGKTTVGRLLAGRLGRPFIDLDLEIERREGRSVADLFAVSGEAGFRAAESKALQALDQGPGPVVATGGGIVLDPENRALMSRCGVRVWLRCPLDELVRRLADAGGRPLWTGDRGELERLLGERTPCYAEAEVAVDATASPAEVAEEIHRLLGEAGIR
jgi:shikimate kinase